MIKGKWKRKIYFTGGKILSFINKWIPKNENKIMIFCKGPLCDNSETLFHYLVDNGYQKKYNIYCVVDKPERYAEYVQENVHFCKLKQSLGLVFTAKYNFYHGEMLAIHPTKNQVWVNYWHGTPLKKINHMLDKLGDYEYDFFTYLTAPKKCFVPIMAQAFDCDESKVILCGHPRNDDLFSKGWEFGKLGMKQGEYKKIVMWMPTYRKSRDGSIVDSKEEYLENGGLPIFHSEESIVELNNYLATENVLLLVKFHPAQNLQDFRLHENTHIKFLSHSQMIEQKLALYKLVKDADFLITDYSSVYFDYLLLDRPIGFTIEDMKEYEDNRGFVFEHPFEYMPGRIIQNKEEFMSFMQDTIAGMDGYEKERARVNALVNEVNTPNNCKRLLEKIGMLL